MSFFASKLGAAERSEAAVSWEAGSVFDADRHVRTMPVHTDTGKTGLGTWAIGFP
jgi:hypothetical protein